MRHEQTINQRTAGSKAVRDSKMKDSTRIFLISMCVGFAISTVIQAYATTVEASENTMSIDQIIKWHSDCASLATMSGYDNKAVIHLKALEPYMEGHAMVINAYSSYAQGMIEGVALHVAGDGTHKEKVVVVAQSIYRAGCPTS